MKQKTFVAAVVSIAAAVSVANLTIGGLQYPFGDGKQIFNVAERIEKDDWPKAAITLVRMNHFKSSNVINAGSNGEIGFVIEDVIADIYGLSQPDETEGYRDLAGTLIAKQIVGQAKWQGTTLCKGEGFSKCEIYLAWPDSAEGQENVTLIGVHLDKGKWALVEKSLLAELERQSP